jgi:hypothetical protein
MVVSPERSGRTLSLLLTLSLGFITVGLLAYVIGLVWMPPQTVTGEKGVMPSEEGYDLGGAPDFVDRDVAGDDKGDGESSDQFVIKTASIDMTVEDLDDASESVRKYAKEVGGSVENLYDSGQDENRSVVATIRVPAAAFDSVVKKLKDMGVDVNTSDENSSDITEVYKDLEARLKNQKALEAQLLEVLDIADEVEDILAVQRELSIVREEIETLQASLDYYDSQTEMSSITVYMSQSSESLDVNSDPWRPVGVFREAVASLVYILKSLGSLLIWAAVLSPLVLVPYWVAKALAGGKRRK